MKRPLGSQLLRMYPFFTSDFRCLSNEYGDLNPSFLDNSNLVGGILLVFMNVFIAEYTISCLSVNLLSILLYLSLIQNVENKSVI